MNKALFPVATLDGETVQVSYLKHVNQKPIFVDEDGNQYVDSDDQIGKVELYKYPDGTKPPKEVKDATDLSEREAEETEAESTS